MLCCIAELCGNTESTAVSTDTMVTTLLVCDVVNDNNTIKDTSDKVQLESQRKSSDRRTLADDDQRPVKKPRIVNDDIDNNKESTDPSETQNQEVYHASYSLILHTNKMVPINMKTVRFIT